MINIILIASGGAIGAVLRYFSFEIITKLLRNSSLANFPVATLFINVTGSFLAGVVYYFIIKNFDNFDPRLKNVVMVGILGGFTTFSAFSLDSFRFLQTSQYSIALIYMLSSVLLSILAVFFGFYSMKLVF